MQENEYKEFLSVEEVAKYLGVDMTTVYRYMKDVKIPLPSMKISRRKILVKKIDLENWLEGFERKN